MYRAACLVCWTQPPSPRDCVTPPTSSRPRPSGNSSAASQPCRCSPSSSASSRASGGSPRSVSVTIMLRRLREAEPIRTGSILSAAGRSLSAGPKPDRQVLCTEYDTGVGIGWHRDKPHFDRVFGLSLGSACKFRFRRRAGAGLGALHARCKTPLALHDGRPVAADLGTQHPGRRGAALLDHVPHHGRSGTTDPRPGSTDRVEQGQMARRTGSADLPLHGGRVPAGWPAHGLARSHRLPGDRPPLRPRRIPAAAFASVLVSVLRRRDGDGLAFLRHHDQRHRRAEARPGAIGTRARYPCLRRPRPAFAPDARRMLLLGDRVGFDAQGSPVRAASLRKSTAPRCRTASSFTCMASS